MTWSRSSSICLLAGAVAVVIGGCQSPWSTGSDVSRWDTSPAPSADKATADATPVAAGDAANRSADIRLGSTSTTGDDQATATMLDDLQQVGQIDPVAQQKLLEQLRKTEPAMRPLVAQQFRASLAYRQQLAGQSPATLPATTAAAPTPEAATARAAADAATPPSDPVGNLVDPRQLHGNPAYEQALAKATPAAIPVPGIDEAGAPALAPPDVPPAFVAAPPGPATGQPAATTEPAPDEADPPTCTSQAPTQASFQSADDDLRGVEPALLRMPGVGPEHLHPSPLLATASLRPERVGTDWRQLVDEAAADLGRRVPDSPQSTAEVHQHVSLRVLQLLAGNTEEALKPIPDVSPAEQQYWSAQLFALATYLDHHSQPDDKRRAAATAVHLDEALADLRELGSLSLRNLTFCKSVYDFGAYEPCDSTCFAPGKQVTLYAEVENYRSESTEKGYSTTLGTSYKIVNDKDELIDGGRFPDVEDSCRSRRRDFHIQYGLALPKDIAPGEYRLELVVKDRLSDKIGHASIPFKIGDSRP
jgi:hypothetical protein